MLRSGNIDLSYDSIIVTEVTVFGRKQRIW